MASSVRWSTAATRSGWKTACRRAGAGGVASWPRSAGWASGIAVNSQRLEMIERLAAGTTRIKGFARRRAEPTDEPGARRATLWATRRDRDLDGTGTRPYTGPAGLADRLWRGYPRLSQLPSPLRGDPLGGPGWCELGAHHHSGRSARLDRFPDVGRDRFHRRAAGIGGCDRDRHPAAG